MRWLNTGSWSKSEAEVNRLVHKVVNAPDFQANDLQNFSAHRENGRLDAANKTSPLEDGFQVASVTIEVPTGEPSNSETSRPYSVPGLHYRKLLNVIKAAFLRVGVTRMATRGTKTMMRTKKVMRVMRMKMAKVVNIQTLGRALMKTWGMYIKYWTEYGMRIRGICTLENMRWVIGSRSRVLVPPPIPLCLTAFQSSCLTPNSILLSYRPPVPHQQQQQPQ